MGMPKLWGKDKDGNRGFLFSHVKTIYYNWASKILLSTKLDEMDALIEEKVAKAMMSNQQVNATDKIPTSALAYAMSQNITKNTNDIAEINGSFRLGSAATEFLCGSDNTALEFLRARNSDGQYHNLIASATGIKFESDNRGTRTTLWEAATKSDFYTINSGLIHANPGIVNHTILHENVGGRGVSNRFITINRGNLEAPEQITVSIDPNGVSETQTPVTIRNNGSSTRDISINLLIIYR